MSYSLVHHLSPNSHPSSISTQAFHFQSDDEKLSFLDRHPAYFLFKNCFSMPRLMYLLRSSPTFQHPDLHADFDDCLKFCATDIYNVSSDDIGWIQATLPIRLGGIGLRRASDLALPAYSASISASQSLISEITQPDNIPHAMDSCLMCGHQPTHHYLKTQTYKLFEQVIPSTIRQHL